MSEPEKINAAEITPLNMPVPTGTAPKQFPAQRATDAVETHSLDSADSTPSPAPAELDAKGRAYDPGKHLHTKNGATGCWMPRGGRKPGSGSKPSPAPQTSSFIPAKEPEAPKEKTADKPGASSNAVPGAERSNDAGVDHSSDAGEVATLAAQTVAGFILDAPDDCTPSPAEHKHMVNTAAAYIRSKGWQSTALVGLLLMFAVWLLKVMKKPKPRETVRSWFTGVGAERARDVTPRSEEQAAGSQPAPSNRHSEIIDLPANIPPLAKL